MGKEWNGQNTFWRSGLRLARRSEKVNLLARTWGCSTYATMDSMLEKESLDFVITSLPWATNPELIKVLVEHGVPVLFETPPAPEVADMIDLWEYVEEKGGKVCVAEQYFSWMRNNRVLVRDYCGEIVNDRVAYSKDFRTPLYMDFIRHIAGGPSNLEGHYLKGIQLGTEWVCENPLAQAPLADDEVAIGALMLGMAAYVGGGVPPYPLAEAC